MGILYYTIYIIINIIKYNELHKGTLKARTQVPAYVGMLEIDNALQLILERLAMFVRFGVCLVFTDTSKCIIFVHIRCSKNTAVSAVKKLQYTVALLLRLPSGKFFVNTCRH